MKNKSEAAEPVPAENTPNTPVTDSNAQMAQALTALAQAIAASNVNSNEQIAQLANAIASNNGNGQIAEAITALKQNALPRQKTVDECDPVSPFNPDGKKNRRLPAIIYQDGVRIEEHVMFDEEIDLLQTIKERRIVGDFLEGRVQIRQRDDGADQKIMVNTSVNSSVERIELSRLAPTFAGRLRRCLEEFDERAQAAVRLEIEKYQRVRAAVGASK